MTGAAIKTIGFMPRRAGIDRAAFRDYYEHHHAPLAAPLFPFQRYLRNHLTDPAITPGFDCFSEFWVTSLDRVGAVLTGEIGDIIRADERHFLDQAGVVAAIAREALPGPATITTLLPITHRGGDEQALINACRTAAAGLDLLSPFDDRPLPYDAMIYLAGAARTLPAGWDAGPLLAVERCESDPATLPG